VLPIPSSSEQLAELAPKIRELAVATRRAGVWNCPTLYIAMTNLEPPLTLQLHGQIIQALQEAGAGLLLGSDQLQARRRDSVLAQFGSSDANLIQEEARTPAQDQLETLYGFAGATHRELQMLVLKAGLTPYQALSMGTRNVAAFYGTSDSTGTIAVGKRADLVLLDGNPLTDIRQTERIAGVMLGGRWLDLATLDQRTAEISAWTNQWCPGVVAAGRPPCPT